MSVQVDVDPSQVAGLADSLRRSARDISAETHKLDSAAQQLAGAWAGDAQQAFAAAYTRARQGLVTQQQLLTRTADEVDALAQRYAQTDLAGARAIPSVE